MSLAGRPLSEKLKLKLVGLMFSNECLEAYSDDDIVDMFLHTRCSFNHLANECAKRGLGVVETAHRKISSSYDIAMCEAIRDHCLFHRLSSEKLMDMMNIVGAQGYALLCETGKRGIRIPFEALCE